MDQPDLYDFAAEYDLLQRLASPWKETVTYVHEMCRTHGTGTPRTGLDLPCGPGVTTIALARSGVAMIGADRSASMVRFAEGAARDAGQGVAFHEGDMRSFRAQSPVDFVLCAGPSLEYLQSNEELLENLAAAADSLADGGLYIIEITSHYALLWLTGAQVVRVDPPWVRVRLGDAPDVWDASEGDTEVAVTFYDRLLECDVERQLVRTRSTLVVTRDGRTRRYVNPVTYRLFMPADVATIATLTGAFEQVALTAGFATGTSLGQDPEAPSAVLVLRRKPRSAR